MTSDEQLDELRDDRMTLLLIDDDPAIHDLVDICLRGVVDTVMHATRPDEGLNIAFRTTPDIVLLDMEMPGKSGLEVCAELRNNDRTRETLVLFLTAMDSTELLVRALDSGGTDYITKPFMPVELQARVRAAIRTRRLIRLLKEHSQIDALTGLSNRGAFDHGLNVSIARLQRTQSSFALLLLDLDHFKSVNDRYGHGVGDEVLRRVGQALREASRGYDLTARYGGEEFAVILNQVAAEDAREISERTLSRIRDIKVTVGSQTVKITASAGLVCSPRSAVSGATLLEIADRALYQAKSTGRNNLVEMAIG